MTEMPRVVVIRDNVTGAVRVDRQTRWGNPFVRGEDGTRSLREADKKELDSFIQWARSKGKTS